MRFSYCTPETVHAQEKQRLRSCQIIRPDYLCSSVSGKNNNNNGNLLKRSNYMLRLGSKKLVRKELFMLVIFKLWYLALSTFYCG